MVSFDIYCNAIFFADFVITFFTPVFEKDGKHIRENHRLAKRYLKTWLIPDLLVCIPITIFRKIGDPKANESQ